MDVNTIIKLIDAGYTRDEISALESAGDGAVNESNAPHIEAIVSEAPESSGPSGSEHPAAPEQPAEPPNELNDLRNIVSSLSEQLKALTRTVQANNIINSEQPAKPVQTAADILASIINPYTSKGEK